MYTAEKQPDRGYYRVKGGDTWMVSCPSSMPIIDLSEAEAKIIAFALNSVADGLVLANWHLTDHLESSVYRDLTKGVAPKTQPVSCDDPRYRAVKVDFAATAFCVWLTDGRAKVIQYRQFPRLAAASDKQRRNYVLIVDGIGIHWPDIDEDISVPLLFNP